MVNKRNPLGLCFASVPRLLRETHLPLKKFEQA